ELRREVLDEHRHEVRGEDDPEQQVAVLGAALDVGGEVAGIHVCDRGDERRPEHREGRTEAALGEDGLERAEAAGAVEDRCGVDGRRRHAVMRIARASTAPRTCTSSPTRTYKGPSNGCRSTTSTAAPGAIPRSLRKR